MKFRSFYLFYILVILLLIAGVLTRDFLTLSHERIFEPTIRKGLWPFFLPTAILSLITGLIYHLFSKIGRQVSGLLTRIHFALVVIGLILSLMIYHPAEPLAMDLPLPISTFDFSNLVFAAPVLLFIALIIFIIALVRSKRPAR